MLLSGREVSNTMNLGAVYVKWLVFLPCLMVVLPCVVLGLENEGWFDPWSLLRALRAKAINLGAVYVPGEVVGFRYRNNALNYNDFVKDLDMLEVSAVLTVIIHVQCTLAQNAHPYFWC